MDPDIVACQGNVALAHINLARYLHRGGNREEAVKHYSAAALILEEAVPTSPITIENRVALASILDTLPEYAKAFHLVDVFYGELRMLKSGEHGSGPAVQEFSNFLSQDLIKSRKWHDELLKNYTLCIISSAPFSEPAFQSVMDKYQALVDGGASDFSLIHTYCSFLLSHPTAPDYKKAGRLYSSVVTDANREHPEFADASFNLGVIKHLEALHTIDHA